MTARVRSIWPMSRHVMLKNDRQKDDTFYTQPNSILQMATGSTSSNFGVFLDFVLGVAPKLRLAQK